MNKESIRGLVAWKNADGVKGKSRETNRALAERDYSKECRTGTEAMLVFEGYFIWWCRAHYQPLPWCDKARAEES